MAVNNTKTLVREWFGAILLIVAELWVQISTVWFWAKLYEELPLLGTEDVVWFFAKVTESVYLVGFGP